MASNVRGWVWAVVIVAGVLAVALVGKVWHDLALEHAITGAGAQPWPATDPPTAGRVEAPATPGTAVIGLPTLSVPSAPLPAVPAPAPPSVVLSGVAMGVGGGNVAIVSINQQPDMLVRVGDALTATASVVRIEESSMTYRYAGTEWRVSVKPMQSVAAPNPPAVPAKPLPGFVASAPAIARAAGAEPGSGNDAFRQAVEKKRQAIAAGR